MRPGVFHAAGKVAPASDERSHMNHFMAFAICLYVFTNCASLLNRTGERREPPLICVCAIFAMIAAVLGFLFEFTVIF